MSAFFSFARNNNNYFPYKETELSLLSQPYFTVYKCLEKRKRAA